MLAFSRSERAASRSVGGEIFVIFDACDFVLGIITHPKVFGIPYLSSGQVIVEGKCFSRVYEKFKVGS